MIDEMIPSFADPRMRNLYDVLLGRREPTMDEKGTLVAVGIDIFEGEGTDPREIRLPNPALARAVGVIMERAWQIDAEGVENRLAAYVQEMVDAAD